MQPPKPDTTAETLIGVCENLAEMFRDSYRIGGMEGGKIENPEVIEEIAQLEANITRLKNDRWISVTESLPDADTEVLVYTASGNYWLAGWTGEKWYETESGEDNNIAWVTHWRHLPEPPTT
jgi:hypothetical protein